MSLSPAAPTTRSDKLFATAYKLALEGKHRDSDDLLALAHEMRELELRLAQIAEHAPPSLAVILVKAAMTGFTNEVSPAEYIESNRDSIQFYAENDSQLHDLLGAIFNPKPYQRVNLSLTDAELEEARVELARRIEREPDRKSVTDPVITPASIAIQARGFSEFLNNGRCSILRQCPECRNKYSTKVHSLNRIYWFCPHCNTIAEA
jgi:hypothetical protein